MITRPTASKFLAFHTIVAFAIASGMFGMGLSGWMRALPLHRPQQPSLTYVLLTAIPLGALVGFVYWYLAWRVARHLAHLVPLKPEVALPESQREAIRRVTARMQLLWLGLFAALGGAAVLIRALFPDIGSIAPMFIVAFIMLPPTIVSFAYRQGLHDAQRLATTPPRNEA